MNVDLHPIFTHFCMSELTLPDAALSNIVKQLDRRKRGNLKCKYMLFLVQISMQMHTQSIERLFISGLQPVHCAIWPFLSAQN
jgi:hypothetical protein